MSDLPTGVAYYTARELADHLRVSTMTIHRAIDAAELPALRLGAAVRILVTDAHDWILTRLTQKETSR